MGLEHHVSGNAIALHVDDVEAARKALEEQGVSFHGDTLDTGVCHMAFFSDPDGNALMLHHRYAPRVHRGLGRGEQRRMAAATTMQLALLPGARELLAMHARELPQRDDLCGAFCGALALRAAGIDAQDGEPLDQDAVALAAGSVVASAHGTLPGGEAGRRDYRLAIPVIEDSDVSGTTAAGVQRALEALAGGELAALPFAGPWDAATLDGLFSLLADDERPASLIANLATHHLWGSRAGVTELLGYLCDGT